MNNHGVKGKEKDSLDWVRHYHEKRSFLFTRLLINPYDNVCPENPEA